MSDTTLLFALVIASAVFWVSAIFYTISPMYLCVSGQNIGACDMLEERQ